MQQFRVDASDYQASKRSFTIKVTLVCNTCSKDVVVIIRSYAVGPEVMPAAPRHLRRLAKKRSVLEAPHVACSCNSVMGINQAQVQEIIAEMRRRASGGESLTWRTPNTSSGSSQNITTYCPKCAVPMTKAGSNHACPICGFISP